MLKRSLLTIEYIRLMILSLLLATLGLPYPCPAQEQVDEETYSISLVQTAEMDKEIHEIEGKKVLAETYAVKGGDYIWDILRRKGLLEKKNFLEILSVLKKLNPSLNNLDLVHPEKRLSFPL